MDRLAGTHKQKKALVSVPLWLGNGDKIRTWDPAVMGSNPVSAPRTAESVPVGRTSDTKNCGMEGHSEGRSNET
jgi:hypothetical protein